MLLIILFCFSFSDDKQIYSTIQMMDQVMVIDPVSLQIEESLSTEFVNINISACEDYISEMDCSMADGCEWMMNMCMNSSSSNQTNTPHFIVLD